MRVHTILYHDNEGKFETRAIIDENCKVGTKTTRLILVNICSSHISLSIIGNEAGRNLSSKP